MTKRKRRDNVVIDTNVFIAHFLSHRVNSPNRRVIRLWLIERAFKLAIARQIENEYLRMFDEVMEFDDEMLYGWQARFNNKRITETFNIDISLRISRDPNDDMFIAAAIAARAKFLITNDRDLLDISDEAKHKFKFQIVTPAQFLKQWDALQ